MVEQWSARALVIQLRHWNRMTPQRSGPGLTLEYTSGPAIIAISPVSKSFYPFDFFMHILSVRLPNFFVVLLILSSSFRCYSQGIDHDRIFEALHGSSSTKPDLSEVFRGKAD